jgi:hypothetical protein
VWHAVDVGMDCDTHHPHVFFAFAVERIKVIHRPVIEDCGYMGLRQHDRDVVKLRCVGHGIKRPIVGVHFHRLIVQNPVGGVFESTFY